VATRQAVEQNLLSLRLGPSGRSQFSQRRSTATIIGVRIRALRSALYECLANSRVESGEFNVNCLWLTIVAVIDVDREHAVASCL
jgi:hypothetical protein